MSGSDTGKILIILGFVLFLVPFFTIPIIMIGFASGGHGNITCAPLAFLVAVIGFVLMIVGKAMGGESSFLGHSFGGRRIPPVQYPRQVQPPREREAVLEIECPGCGASPTHIDHFGICTCEFCKTKFKVR